MKSNFKNKFKNILLIGLSGTGKSTIASMLASALDMQAVETDGILAAQEGKPITHIFSENGESYFRNLESALAKHLSEKSGNVISTGGGIVVRSENIPLLKASGINVLLLATPETIVGRIKNAEDRPLLNNDSKLDRLNAMWHDRKENYYAAADICIDTEGKNAKEVIAEIIDALEQYIPQ